MNRVGKITNDAMKRKLIVASTAMTKPKVQIYTFGTYTNEKGKQQKDGSWKPVSW